ncbi:hypothetical protein [Priestia flexa]|uniref:hypothetical protein n=1 Tax=Priestia flexa TaxID=86664 RepID=UPI000473FCF2|nr:hypothetical protein [Priestia flexa]
MASKLTVITNGDEINFTGVVSNKDEKSFVVHSDGSVTIKAANIEFKEASNGNWNGVVTNGTLDLSKAVYKDHGYNRFVANENESVELGKKGLIIRSGDKVIFDSKDGIINFDNFTASEVKTTSELLWGAVEELFKKDNYYDVTVKVINEKR